MATLLEGLGHELHPVHALRLRMRLVEQRQQMGDSAAATRLLVAIGSAVARDGRPLLRSEYIARLATEASHAGLHERSDSLTRERISIARKAGNAPMEFRALEDRGSVLAFRRGDAREAITPLTRGMLLARRIGSRELVAIASIARGRAYSALGRFAEAEADLRTALAETAPDEATRLSEIHHNLMHAYEGQARWGDAVREADLYIRLARRLREGSATYMMSLHDVGLIRWNAGWHAAARGPFEQMVQEIEARNDNHFYAGEYYERVGDFSRAAAYYSRGARSTSTGELHQNLAGLTRMYRALGLADSARATATQHDRLELFAESRLLPTALFDAGRADEGLALARADVSAQAAKGSPRLMAVSRLQLARLLLEARQPAEAERTAAGAERITTAARLTELQIESIRIRGIAQLRQRSPASLATLTRARDLVRAHPTAASELDVELALGDAFGALERTEEALAAYDRAARVGEGITSSFASALDRARHRDRRSAPFDGALRVLLSLPESSPGRAGQVLAWSQRKKSAVFAEGVAARGVPRAERLETLQRRLGDSTALVDFMTVDSLIFAHVITAGHARIAQLHLSVASASQTIERLRRPLAAVEAGQLDLARAPFDLRLAHDLFRGLIAPLESSLAGIRHVMIVPDGPLHDVPFAALPAAMAGEADYHRARYVIDRYVVTLAPSPTLTGEPRASRRPADARVLVLRGAVPGGERETAAVLAAWPSGRATALTGARATEAALRQGVAMNSILHFAVHARLDAGDPLASHLELSPGGDDDGLLHVNEISALGFRGDLVVLTGCETMPGRRYAGTGPFGLANGFLAAGARGVIATLWPLGESAATLSRDLHGRLSRGVAPSEALREAQLTVRRDPATAHPFHWGGYVLIARSR